jgi:GABA(A) receptor-associated protein
MKNNQFMQKYSFEERFKESNRIIKKYPNRIPIIIERFNNSIPDIKKKKYLVPDDLILGQFIYVIRKQMSIPIDKAVYLFINNKLPINSSTIGIIYEEYKNKDGFLYIKYSFENTFG